MILVPESKVTDPTLLEESVQGKVEVHIQLAEEARDSGNDPRASQQSRTESAENSAAGNSPGFKAPHESQDGQAIDRASVQTSAGILAGKGADASIREEQDERRKFLPTL